MGDLDLMWGL
uniref:Uncharacterized protein n=1 Tax=Anguilla anguilla TaxID=7936 RepID=A0A0E9VIK9_ANGAN